MKKTLRLSESDLKRIVERILNEQDTENSELEAMKEIQLKTKELMDFTKAKCMEVYNDEERCTNFMKLFNNRSLSEINADYENIFSALK